MIPYILLLAGISTAWVITSQRGQSPSGSYGPFLVIATLMTSAFIGLRSYGVGADTLAYFGEYQSGMVRESEPGYSMVAQWSARAGLDFRSFLLIAALAATGAAALMFGSHSKSPPLGMIMFILMGPFALAMTGMRQSIAIAIATVAFLTLLRGKRIAFAALILVAYQFHNTAIMLLPFALFYSKGQMTRTRAAVLLAVAGLIGTQWSLGTRALERMGLVKYEDYLESASSVNPLVILVAFAIPVACIALWPEVGGRSQNARGSARRVPSFELMYVVSIANFASVVAAIEVPIATRYTHYFSTIVIVMLTNLAMEQRVGPSRTIATAACVILPLIQFAISTPSSSLGIYPYTIG
ncbi:EpsG family protein [Nostocoides veronense]|uniref:EpsG family protein n=1 Tax=Nostocoides veronense TaxID=330836 RepID=A0ABP4XU04_9MICO